jgi:hypothetical protein
MFDIEVIEYEYNDKGKLGRKGRTYKPNDYPNNGNRWIDYVLERIEKRNSYALVMYKLD